MQLKSDDDKILAKRSDFALSIDLEERLKIFCDYQKGLIDYYTNEVLTEFQSIKILAEIKEIHKKLIILDRLVKSNRQENL